jgi:hypothetical protein
LEGLEEGSRGGKREGTKSLGLVGGKREGEEGKMNFKTNV